MDQSQSQVGITTEIPSWKNYHKVFSVLLKKNDQRSNHGSRSIYVVLKLKGRMILCSALLPINLTLLLVQMFFRMFHSSLFQVTFSHQFDKYDFYIYLLLTEFEDRTVSYGPSFFLLDLWPKREARGP